MRLMIFILGLFLSSVSFAFSEADLVKQLQQPQNVQGNFIQHRYLKALNKPIEMQGQFALLAQKGLLWQLEKPFNNSLRVTPNGIQQWNGTQWVNSGNVGQNEQIGLFLGVLSGNIDGLKSQFDFALSGNANQWQLTLTPNSLLMQQIFTTIEISGDQTVKKLTLNEKQGDRTQIEFKQIQLNQSLSQFARSALE